MHQGSWTPFLRHIRCTYYCLVQQFLGSYCNPAFELRKYRGVQVSRALQCAGHPAIQLHLPYVKTFWCDTAHSESESILCCLGLVSDEQPCNLSSMYVCTDACTCSVVTAATPPSQSTGCSPPPPAPPRSHAQRVGRKRCNFSPRPPEGWGALARRPSPSIRQR